MNTKITFSMLIVLLLGSCNRIRNERSAVEEAFTDTDSMTMVYDLEAWQDSLELAHALSLRSSFTQILMADLETEPVESAEGEDAADDPAIWYNMRDPANSLILGTDKNLGIYVYDLKGRLLQSIKAGRINNIDLRDEFSYGGKEVVLVAGSNRSNNCITLFTLDKESGILSDSIINIPSGVDEVYGICIYKKTKGNEFHVFVNGKGGGLEQWKLSTDDGIRADLLRRTRLSSQPEGMVADDHKGKLYLGVEMEGIFSLDADPEGDTSIHLLPGSTSENENIVYDIEGLALFSYNQNDYLIASSQGNFSYAIFDLKDQGSYLTSFVISDGHIDGVEETDGLDIITRPLNDQFPEGILVVQDGFNTKNCTDLSQNFKYISVSKIFELLDKL